MEVMPEIEFEEVESFGNSDRGDLELQEPIDV